MRNRIYLKFKNGFTIWRAETPNGDILIYARKLEISGVPETSGFCDARRLR